MRMARIGYLYLRGGRWNGKEILPGEFRRRGPHAGAGVVGLPEHDDPDTTATPRTTTACCGGTTPTAPCTSVPRDAYWSWGLYDSLIVVIPSLDLVVARAGQVLEADASTDHYDVLRPFLEPIVRRRCGPPCGQATGLRIRRARRSGHRLGAGAIRSSARPRAATTGR